MPGSMPLPNMIADNGAAKRRVPRLIEAQFGDGYGQRAADGLNHWIDEWDVSWIPLNSTDKDTVVSALDASGGWDYLTWTPPGESTSKKFILDGGYSIRPIGPAHWIISAKFKQVFNV